MAAGTITTPGTKYGPCKETCKHKDCAGTRAMAASICPGCKKAIGYNAPFYNLGLGEWPTDLHFQGYAHATCTEEAIEA